MTTQRQEVLSISQPQALMQMGVLFHDCHPACETCERNVVTGTVRFPGGLEDIDSRCTGLPHECAALREGQSQKEEA